MSTNAPIKLRIGANPPKPPWLEAPPAPPPPPPRKDKVIIHKIYKG